MLGLETTHNLIIEYLWSQAYQQVYATPPSVVKSNRNRFRQSGARDDQSDGYLLADILRTDRGRLQPWHPDSLLTRQMRAKVSWIQHLTRASRRLSNRLRAVLLGYYPAALQGQGQAQGVERRQADLDLGQVRPLIFTMPELKQPPLTDPGVSLGRSAVEPHPVAVHLINPQHRPVQRGFQLGPGCGVSQPIQEIGQPIVATCVVMGWRSPEYYQMDAWREKWISEGGGVLDNQPAHQLDVFQWLMGPIEELFGYGDNFNHPYIEVEDTAAALVRFKSGAIGQVLVSNSMKPGFYGKIHVHGCSRR